RWSRLAGEDAPGDLVDGRARVAAHAAGVAGGDQARRAGDGGRLRFQPRDHVVDFAARLADLRVDLFVQPAPERFLALTQGVFALPQPAFDFAQRLAFTRHEPPLVFERPHVVIDLRQVLGELRFARAQVVARRGDDGRI